MLKSILIGLFTFSSISYASNVYDPQFQTVQEVSLYEVVESEHGAETEVLISTKKVDELKDFVDSVSTRKNLAGVIMVTRDLIALGKEIYEIVKAGRPVVHTNSEPLEILPKDEDGQVIQAMDLSEWKQPLVKKYRVATKNYLGMKPASFDFMLIFSYGGTNRGKGRYISGAEVRASSVNVSWGYNLDVQTKVKSIINEGKWDDPVAGVTLSLDYKISTILQEKRDSKTFYINGLGDVRSY